MIEKLNSCAAFISTTPYDWYPETWQLYALVLGLERQSYPNAPKRLEDRINMRRN